MRERFEAWFCIAYHPSALQPMENGCYLNGGAGMAWDAWQAATATERERCKQAIRDTRDKSGVNEDGQSWLQRAGRSDFIAAIDAL